jgi:hypothetical protein
VAVIELESLIKGRKTLRGSRRSGKRTMRTKIVLWFIGDIWISRFDVKVGWKHYSECSPEWLLYSSLVSNKHWEPGKAIIEACLKNRAGEISDAVKEVVAGKLMEDRLDVAVGNGT